MSKNACFTGDYRPHVSVPTSSSPSCSLIEAVALMYPNLLSQGLLVFFHLPLRTFEKISFTSGD